MKRVFTITLMLLITGLTNAQQQISNPGFESWDVKGDYTEPTDWNTLNPLVQFGLDASTIMITDAHSGNYAVKLESLATSFTDLSGVLCTGPILDDQLNPDFSKMKVAFSGAPQKFEFYYKSDPEVGDTSVISMCLTHWNTTLQQTDTVASASKLFYDSIGVYTHASIDFEYLSSVPADSMFIIASSSADGFNPTVGSVLILDDLLLVYGATGIDETTKVLEASVYPNPAQDVVYVKLQKSQRGVLSIYDLLGDKVHTQSFSGTELTVATNALSEGLYMIIMQSENGQSQTYKVAIKK